MPRPSVDATVLASRFGIDPVSLTALGAFESEVLAGDGPSGPAVLKVIDPAHRTAVAVQGELAWLRALGAEGIPVARPLRATDGSWVVVRAPPSRKLGVAFVRAPGRHIPRSEWTPDLLEAYGALLGRLHEHARRWRPASAPKRPSWLDPAYAHRAAEVRPDDQAFVEAVAEALAGLAIVPSGADEVGIVHGDLHTGNVLVADDGTITAIDFDDAVIGPFLYDLAIPIYYGVGGRDGDAAARTTSFLEPFLAGFDRQAPRPNGGAAAVAACLAARQADLAVALYDGVADGRLARPYLEHAERLRDAVVARTVPAPYEVLTHFFGD